jgi:hypothetical protein
MAGIGIGIGIGIGAITGNAGFGAGAGEDGRPLSLELELSRDVEPPGPAGVDPPLEELAWLGTGLALGLVRGALSTVRPMGCGVGSWGAASVSCTLAVVSAFCPPVITM